MTARQNKIARIGLPLRWASSKGADALQRRGLALGKRGRLDEAAACCGEALQIRLHFPEAHFCLGRVFAKKGQWDKAVGCFEAALQQRARFPAVLNRMGTALTVLNRVEEAIACYRKLLQQQPKRFPAYLNLANACILLGRLDESLEQVEHALRLKPDNPEAHVIRALLWHGKGDLARGLPEYEWRWRLKRNQPRVWPKPLWDGTALAGRTILLHPEQGLGDTLQFIRYATVLKESGARVIMESPPALNRLLALCPGIDQLLTTGSAWPDFDVHAPLLSLPWLSGTSLTSIPARAPYLVADPRLVDAWRQKLDAYPGFKVGIVWQGNSKHPDDRHRSIPLSHFAPLARVPGVRLISLQKGEGTDQLAKVADRFPVIDLGKAVDEAAGPFMDTAAIIKNLDLVIACDTAVMHLAGGLGVPVWLPLSVASDWRWFQEREDSPWYPTMRLFRQKELDGWPEVFSRLAEALERQCHRLADPRPITIEVSPGELLDKITILEIKSRRIRDPEKRRNILVELDLLHNVREVLALPPGVDRLTQELKTVNETIWEIEDKVRRCELKGDFGPDFVSLARSIYLNNDRRARLKRQINKSLGSRLMEEKSLPSYAKS